MRFEVHIGTDNAAFRDEETGQRQPEWEVSRILRELADRLDPAAEGTVSLVVNEPVRLSDASGNRVGYAILQPGEAPYVEAWGA